MFLAHPLVRSSDPRPLLLELRRRLARQIRRIKLVHLLLRTRIPLLPEHRNLVHGPWTALTLRGLRVTTTNARRLAAMVTPRRVVAKMTALLPPIATTSRGRRAAQTTITTVATTDALHRRRRGITVPGRRLRVGPRTIITNPRQRLTITTDQRRRLTIMTSAHPSPAAAAVPLRHRMTVTVRLSRAAVQMVGLAVVLLRPQATKAERRGRVRVRTAAMAPPALLLKAQQAAAAVAATTTMEAAAAAVLALTTRAVTALAKAAATVVVAAAAPIATIALLPRLLMPVAQRQARAVTTAVHRAGLLRRHRQTYL